MTEELAKNPVTQNIGELIKARAEELGLKHIEKLVPEESSHALPSIEEEREEFRKAPTVVAPSATPLSLSGALMRNANALLEGALQQIPAESGDKKDEGPLTQGNTHINDTSTTLEEIVMSMNLPEGIGPHHKQPVSSTTPGSVDPTVGQLNAMVGNIENKVNTISTDTAALRTEVAGVRMDFAAARRFDAAKDLPKTFALGFAVTTGGLAAYGLAKGIGKLFGRLIGGGQPVALPVVPETPGRASHQRQS